MSSNDSHYFRLNDNDSIKVWDEKDLSIMIDGKEIQNFPVNTEFFKLSDGVIQITVVATSELLDIDLNSIYEITIMINKFSATFQVCQNGSKVDEITAVSSHVPTLKFSFKLKD